jgi:hypothetical protein
MLTTSRGEDPDEGPVAQHLAYPPLGLTAAARWLDDGAHRRHAEQDAGGTVADRIAEIEELNVSAGPGRRSAGDHAAEADEVEQ